MHQEGHRKQVTQTREMRESINVETNVVTMDRTEVLPMTYKSGDCIIAGPLQHAEVGHEWTSPSKSIDSNAKDFRTLERDICYFGIGKVSYQRSDCRAGFV